MVDGRDLTVSDALGLTTVPTLLRRENGREVARTESWSREAWEALTGRC